MQWPFEPQAAKASRAHVVQERKKGIDKRAKLNAADNVARMKQPTVSGATPWEKVTSVVDFTFQVRLLGGSG